MKIDFVNHASLVLSHGNVRMLCDPWFDGTSFNDGWALLAPTAFTPADFEGVTHIWYSHEHPDHFSPGCLATAPEALRPGITVLFHESEDRKLIRHCEKMGFATQELRAGEVTPLGEDFRIRCSRWDHTDDSWLLVEADGTRLLNLNDCLVNTAEDMARLKATVGDIDVLMSQFSIAAWDGNAEDHERRNAGGRAMLARTVLQCRDLAPRWIIPFASFVWFCHEENHYMNSAVVRVDEVETAVREQTATTPVVLYPGDAWQVGEAHRNDEAVAAYGGLYRSLPERERIATQPVALPSLLELAEPFRARVNGHISPLRLRVRMARMNARFQRCVDRGWRGRVAGWLALATLRPRPARLWLRDLDQSVSFDLRRGLVPDSRPQEDCDVSLSSDSLAYAFRFLWGGSSLQINGRFHEERPEGRLPLFEALWMADGLNREAGAEARPL